MNNKILIVYATYGSGHKAIANYIKDYFLCHNSKLSIKVLDILDYSKKTGIISKRFSESLQLKFPTIWNLFYKIADHRITSKIYNKLSMNWFNQKELEKMVVDFNPDLIISTHFYGSILARNLNRDKKIDAKLITIITDYFANNVWYEHYYGKDYFVVASKEEEKTLLKEIKQKNIKVFGIPIFPRKVNLDEVSIIKKNLKVDNGKPICVCFAGGGAGSTSTISYIKSIIKSNLNINYIFISGNNKKAYSKIKQLINKYKVKYCTLYGYVNNVPELLMISDFVITKPGGAQTTECLYFNKPMLFIKSSGGQENYNIKFFVKKGYAKYFKKAIKLQQYLNKLSDNMDDINKMKNKLEKTDNTKAMKELYNFANYLLR